MSIIRRDFLILIAAAATVPSNAWPQDYPAHPLRFIVPLAPGGGLDFVARLIGEDVSQTIGQQVAVENRSGAGGTIGIEDVSKAAPDGYTVLICNDNIASAPHILKVNGDYLTDFSPVIELARQPLVLSVHHSLGVTSLAELVALAKRSPGLGFATSGVGSNQHILGAWFAKVAGITLEHIPYRGAGQAVADVLADRVPISVLGPTALLPHYKSGILRLLAQSPEARSPVLPEIPTFREAGIAEVSLYAWYGVFVPARTPTAIIDQLNGAMNRALSKPKTRDRLLETATEPVGGNADTMSRLWREDFEKYGKLVKELNISSSAR